MAEVQSEKSVLLSQCSQLQRDLVESKEKLMVAEERARRQENNCQLLMDTPLLGCSEAGHEGYLKSLSLRQSQRLISANTVRIMLLEKQNSELRGRVAANSSGSTCTSSSSQRNEVRLPNWHHSCLFLCLKMINTGLRIAFSTHFGADFELFLHFTW